MYSSNKMHMKCVKQKSTYPWHSKICKDRTEQKCWQWGRTSESAHLCKTWIWVMSSAFRSSFKVWMCSPAQIYIFISFVCLLYNFTVLFKNLLLSLSWCILLVHLCHLYGQHMLSIGHIITQVCISWYKEAKGTFVSFHEINLKRNFTQLVEH